MKIASIQTSYDIDMIRDLGCTSLDIINELNEISKKVRVLALDHDGIADVEYSSRNSLKEFIINMMVEDGGPAVNEAEVEEYLNEVIT